MSPQEFYERCESHDWYYMYSDDPKVYHLGCEQRRELEDLAEADPSLRPILQRWVEHAFSGPAFGTIEQKPKPERPAS